MGGNFSSYFLKMNGVETFKCESEVIRVLGDVFVDILWGIVKK